MLQPHRKFKETHVNVMKKKVSCQSLTLILKIDMTVYVAVTVISFIF